MAVHLSKAQWLRQLVFFGFENSGSKLGSKLGSSTQVQRLRVGLKHGKAGLEGRARRLDSNHTHC